MNAQETLWSASETAAYLAIDVTTLHRWRRDGTGPPCFQLGEGEGRGRSVVRYDPHEVRRWLADRVAPAVLPEQVGA